MREPEACFRSEGMTEYQPFSQLPDNLLRRAPDLPSNGLNEWYDPDFRRRYVAILLKERGL